MKFTYKTIAHLCLCILAFQLKAANVVNAEKVFVQLNNSLFIPPDSVFYKAYVVNASSLTKSVTSKILYFELLNTNGVRCLFWRTNLVNGMVAGNMPLPDTLTGGVYTLRAFTNYMRNWGSNYYFATNIMVTKLSANNLKAVCVPLQQKNNSYNALFFPEGGQLINNLPCKVGVRLNTVTLAKQFINGIVKSSTDSIVATFTSNTAGLAQFTFTPTPNNNYTVLVTDTAGLTQTYILPIAQQTGITVNVMQLNNMAQLTINATLNYTAQPLPYKLKIAMRGNILSDTAVVLTATNNKVAFKIPYSGIANICIYNPYNQLVCQKLHYLEAVNETSLLQTIALKPTYPANSNLLLNLKANTVFDTFNLGIVVATTNPFQFLGTNQSMVQYLNFFSEIPQSHFIQIQPNSFSAQWANMLLLTIKSNTYYWNQIVQTQASPKFLPETFAYTLQGKVYTNNKPLINTAVCASVADSLPSVNYTLTDSAGCFNIPLNASFDNQNLMLQLLNTPDSINNLSWFIDNKSDTLQTPICCPYPLSQQQLQYLANLRNIKLANTIYQQPANTVTDTIIPNITTHRNNFEPVPTYTVHTADYIELENFNDVVNNILPSVSFNEKNGKLALYIYNAQTKTAYTQPATVFLNGLPFNNCTYLKQFAIANISKVQVTQSQIMYGQLTFNGIVEVVTTNIKTDYSKLTPNVFVYNNKANLYTHTKSVAYASASETKHTQNINLQPILYQNQFLQLNTNENINIQTTSLKQGYNVSIQGLTTNGNIISENLYFNVE